LPVVHVRLEYLVRIDTASPDAVRDDALRAQATALNFWDVYPSLSGRFDGTIVMVYVTGSVCQFRRWNGVLPEV
jgi:hypothetical protein